MINHLSNTLKPGGEISGIVKFNKFKTMSEKVYGVQPKVQVTDKVQTEVYEEIFTLVTRNRKTQIAVTNKIVCPQVFNSVKDAKRYIDSKPWHLICNVISIIFEITDKEMNKNNKKEEK